jgi:hypothetical protein
MITYIDLTSNNVNKGCAPPGMLRCGDITKHNETRVDLLPIL